VTYWIDRLLEALKADDLSDHHRTYLRAKLFAGGIQTMKLGGGPVIVPPWVYEALRDEVDPLPKQPPKDDRPFFDPDAKYPPVRWSNEPPTLEELRVAWRRDGIFK
jgi:hypothetical protein